MEWFQHVYAPHHRGLLVASALAFLCLAGIGSLLLEKEE